MMKKTIIIQTALCLAGIAFMLLGTSSCDDTVKSNKTAEDQYVHTKDIPKEYSNLFTPQAMKKFDFFFTQTAKSGLKISAFNYDYVGADGNAYGNQFEVFKINLADNKPLSDIIHITQNGKIEDVTDAESITLIGGEIKFKYKDGNGDTTNNVKLNYIGDEFKVNKQQDDLLYLSFRLNKMSISYDNGSHFLIKKHGISLLSQNGKLIFIKKDKILYMIFIDELGLLPPKPDTTLTLLN